MSLKNDLVRVIRDKSYREGDFTLASGQKSKFYIDMKATTLDPEGADLLGRLATEVLVQYSKTSGHQIEGVGGLTLGADPIATAVSLSAFRSGIRWPAFIVRKESKGHGTDQYVEGKENLRTGASVIVLEDVVTTGGSSVKAIERLRNEGFKPVAVLTVVDREAGGEAAFKKMGVDFLSLVKISEISSK